MADLLQSAKMFEASAKTQLACTYLQDLAQGGEPDDKVRKTLIWVGALLPQVDWDYTGKLKKQASNSLFFEATCARPAFYASLVKMREQFKKAGMESEDEIATFLASLYSLLSSGGQDSKVLSEERMDLAAGFLSELANAIRRKYGSRMPDRPSLLGCGL